MGNFVNTQTYINESGFQADVKTLVNQPGVRPNSWLLLFCLFVVCCPLLTHLIVYRPQ